MALLHTLDLFHQNVTAPINFYMPATVLLWMNTLWRIDIWGLCEHSETKSDFGPHWTIYITADIKWAIKFFVAVYLTKFLIYSLLTSNVYYSSMNNLSP